MAPSLLARLPPHQRPRGACGPAIQRLPAGPIGSAFLALPHSPHPTIVALCSPHSCPPIACPFCLGFRRAHAHEMISLVVRPAPPWLASPFPLPLGPRPVFGACRVGLLLFACAPCACVVLFQKNKKKSFVAGAPQVFPSQCLPLGSRMPLRVGLPSEHGPNSRVGTFQPVGCPSWYSWGLHQRIQKVGCEHRVHQQNPERCKVGSTPTQGLGLSC